MGLPQTLGNECAFNEELVSVFGLDTEQGRAGAIQIIAWR
jgi:hypothetical protein